jgi:hypothetical protein
MRCHRPVQLSILSLAALLSACATGPASNPMGFFVTSAGPGKGADLGGLAGADAHCQKLAASAGAGQRTWRAYLSTSAVAGTAATSTAAAVPGLPAVNARDRIGKGPWFNAKGEQIARDVDHLHGANNLLKTTALTEKGAVVNGRGDTPNQHDILTGSRLDGTAFSPAPNLTCGNWTLSGEGAAIIGHHDRAGLTTDAWALSWNSSHQTRGCGQDALKSTGGAGQFYCFAAD